MNIWTRSGLLGFLVLVFVKSFGQPPNLPGGGGFAEPAQPPKYNSWMTIGYSKDLDLYAGFNEYLFPQGKNSEHVVGIAITKSNSHVYAWYKDGTVSSGISIDLDFYTAPQSYTLPPGKGYGSIVSIAIASDDHVFTWYTDGTVSSGTSRDLDYYYPPKKCTPPSGKTVSDVVGVGIAKNDRVYYWYKDGTVSAGTTDDWDKYIQPTAYTLAPTKNFEDIVDIDIAKDDKVYTWYHGRARGEAWSSVETQIDKLVLEVLDSTKIPGLTVSASKRGKMVVNKSYGVANLETKRSMLPDHATQIGSTSKVVATGMGVMKLAEERSHEDFLGRKLYGPDGLLSSPAYQDAIIRGIKRRRPIVGMDITGTNDHVYTWYSNGMVTSGATNNLALHSEPKPYILPGNKTPDEILGIAINKSDNHIYAWYEDGSYSSGISTDLGYYFYKPVTVVNDELVPAYTAPFSLKRIIGIAIAPGDKVYAWYEHGKVSVGTYEDFSAHEAPKDFIAGAGRDPYDIRDFAIAGSTSRVYVWYSDGKATSGTSTDLTYYHKPYNYTMPASLVNEGVSEWKGYYDKMELRHLMTHTSGFVRSGDLTGAALMFDKSEGEVTYEQLHRYMLRTHRLKFEPGTKSEYSNHNFGLCGHIITTMSGIPYDKYVKDKVLKPIGLDRVTPISTVKEDTRYYSAPHHLVEDKNEVLKGYGLELTQYAAGGWLASAQDLVRIMLATDKMENHSDVLKPETLDLMEKPPFASAPGSAYAWGVHCVNSSCNARKLTHSGLIAGGNSVIAKFAQGYMLNNVSVGRINVAICSNTGANNTGALAKLMDKIATILGEASIPSDYELITKESVDHPDNGDFADPADPTHSKMEAAAFDVYPVPSEGPSTVAFTLKEASQVTVEVYNWSGFRIQSVILQENLRAGKYEYNIGSHNWPKGLYVVRFISKGKLHSRTISIE